MINVKWLQNRKLKITLKVLFWLVTIGCYFVTAAGVHGLREKTSISGCNAGENVKVISLLGGLQDYTDDTESQGGITLAADLVSSIENADKDPGIKYIILEIDSPGGETAAAEEVVAALKHISKPTVALVKDQGLSAGLWVATAANTVYAYQTATLGSIGVTLSYTDNVGQNQKDGVTFHDLTSGKYKNIMNPDKPLTPDEEANIREQIDYSYAAMVQSIVDSRHLDKAKLLPIADGRLLTSQQALDAGLIDQIGTKYDVVDFIQGKIGQPVMLCE